MKWRMEGDKLCYSFVFPIPIKISEIKGRTKKKVKINSHKSQLFFAWVITVNYLVYALPDTFLFT